MDDREEVAAAEVHVQVVVAAVLLGEVQIQVEVTRAAPEEVVASHPPLAEAHPSAVVGSLLLLLALEVWPLHPHVPVSGKCSSLENTI